MGTATDAGTTLLGLQPSAFLVLGFSLVRNLKFKNKGWLLDYWRAQVIYKRDRGPGTPRASDSRCKRKRSWRRC